MKNILFATTALVATAGIASADVTFSGTGEAGIYRTEKVEAKAATLGKQHTYAYASGVLTKTAVDTAADAASVATAKLAVAVATVAVNDAQSDLNAAVAALDAAMAGANAVVAVPLTTERADVDNAKNALVAAQAELARVQAELDAQSYGAVTAVAAGDMTAYSGYQADVTLSTETDSGIKFTMGFDLEAGLMADKDDDLEMDTKDGSIANSTLTMEANGYTLVIGQDEIDDLYDDSQNGDISLSGAMGGLSFTIVHDLEDSVLAKAATVTTATQTDRAVGDIYTGTDGDAIAALAAGTPAAGESDFALNSFADAVAAVNEGTSVKLGYAMGNATLGLVATSANDRNNSANKVTLDYTVSDTLSFSVAHDSQGKRDAITSASVTYAIDALTITAKYADDKNHAGNTNKDGKASTNLTVGYTQGPISATFATDESSAWWINANYDLGGGASAFATVDHSEFAVAGLSFAF